MKKKLTQQVIMPPPNPSGSAAAQADHLLLRIREAAAALQKNEAAYAQEMEALKQRYEGGIDAARQTLAVLEADLESFAKANKHALFPAADTRLDLQHGAMIYTIEKRVKRIRDMLTRLENARRHELIKIAKSVDWDSVEKLEDAELVALGTRRHIKERFAYELKG